MKIIFLDVDGVLNHIGCRTRTPGGVYFVEDDKIKLLKELAGATGAKIVLTSSWRKGWFDFDNGITSEDNTDFCMLREKLLEYGLEIMSRTPITNRGHRGSEIDMWLNAWKGENIESIVILDDHADMHPYSQFLVRTFFEDGLTRKDVKRAIKILNQKLESVKEPE